MQKSRLSNSSFGSPVKSHNLERLEEDKQYIIKTIHYLFVFYTSKASRYAYKQINEKSFMELMTDVFELKGVKLIKNSDAWKKMVTIYHGKGKKTTMEYEQFLKCLPSISELFDRSQKSEDELRNLLKHLMIVYEKKVAKDIQQKYVHFDSTLSRETTDYIEKLSENLYKIYKIYFPEEITNQSSRLNKLDEKVFEQVVLLFKEFEIYPKIISASQLYLIFQEIFNSPAQNPFTWMDQRNRIRDRVSYFGFSKYLQLLVRISMVSINRLREVEDPEWWLSRQKQCLKALFQYMESVKTKTKNSRFQHVRFSLILYEQYKNERERWLSLSVDQQMKPTSNRGDFFDLFEKMKL